ncbi:MAG: 4-hydroxy-3-methylbut-2-enyl diphosphate reductase [Patescibacteria group bacterium]|nr:4-hydroxy-3-methylbut-2-enyl diphosphate reductase [Patescibacteria group bacterium]
MKMKIIVAKNIGFCTGVKRALDIARKSLEKDPLPVQFLGGLIHNEEIIKEIKNKGGIFISDPKEAKSGTLVIRAHGTPPLPPLNNVFIRDATCPLVKRVQEAAKSLFKKGYQVIIIGEKEHAEVKGIRGQIGNKAIVVENELAAKKIKQFKKIGVVTQTTQNLEKVNRILKILKRKATKIKFVNTLCPQVSLRQEEISQLLKKVDGVLVIGSAKSANTNQLVKIAKISKKPVWLVNSAKEIKKQDFKGINVLGVISGTSAPDWNIEKIKKRLMQL